MKKFTLLTCIAIIFSISGFSQNNDEKLVRNCGTMLQLEQIFKKNPGAKLFAEQSARMIQPGPLVQNYRTSAIVTIPIVVHIVLPNPNLVTDADVQFQINKLNIDYSGLNPDSINEPAQFLALRGHSQIRFTLARRTPSGALTTGIERIVSNVGSNLNLSVDPIKRASSGGADVWDPTSYLNIWVGIDASGNSLLGYSSFPGSGALADDGVFISYHGFANNPCYTNSTYNKGRTMVHEIGHYLGLFHIWGDEDACTGDDFKQLPGSCLLPSGLFNPVGQGNTGSDIGDTPNQASATTNCPSGNITDACATIAPGKMYQDFMDYTADACYSMFTSKQVQRMEWVLDNCRTSLETSLGGTAPAGAVTLDATPVQSVNPGGSEIIGCNTVSYVSSQPCPGSIIPKVRIINKGLNTLNTVTVGLIINGGAPVTQNVSPNLPFGYSTVVSFPSVNFVSGINTLKFFTSNPNGVQPDQVPSNDTITTTFTISAPVLIPIVQGFETSPFPPAGWSLFNPNSNNTWVRVSPGSNSSFSAAIDNYNFNDLDEVDDIRTPKITFTPADTVLLLSFDVAHKYFPDPSSYDTLSVLVSSDCGATFTTVYKKFGPSLATADTSSLPYITPVLTDWRKERITLRGNILSSGNIIVAFRNTNRFGNNIFLDNINIAPPGPGDVKLVSIDQPAPIICSPAVTPTVTLQNAGTEALTSLSLSYSVDNGPVTMTNFSSLNLGANQQVSLTLNPPFNVGPGSHTIKIFASNASTIFGSRDTNTSNDTLQLTFTLAGRVNVPITEGFESTTFPPANWVVDNPDGSITWERSTLAAKSGNASMVIRNFDYSALNTIDRFVSPVISNVSSFDSVFVSFDVAYSQRNANASVADTLELKVSRDCGQTYTTAWRNWGTGLQTTASAAGTRFIPTASDWANARVLLTPFISGPSFQLYFVAKGNNQNNLYIDNINIFGINLPQRLKDQGYEIYPNPFHNSFIIHHYYPPITLQNISIYNSFGALMWQQQLNGLGDGQINVNLSNLASGVYFVNLTYRDKVIVEKVVKN